MPGIFRTCLLCASIATGALAQAVRYTADNQLIRPTGYREWVFLSSGVSAGGGTSAPQRFANIFAHPDAYKAFLATGKWPEGAVLAAEYRTASSQDAVIRGSHYQTGILFLEFEVKDASRFPNGWGYFKFNGPEEKLAASAPPQPATASCHNCHGPKTAVEHTFVQFYPTLLEVARRKQTLKTDIHPAP